MNRWLVAVGIVAIVVPVFGFIGFMYFIACLTGTLTDVISLVRFQ